MATPAGMASSSGVLSSSPMAAVVEDALTAVRRIRNGDTIMFGGFGLVGAPLRLIQAIARSDLRGLTAISNNMGSPGQGLGLLVREKRLRKVIGSFFTSNPEVAQAWRAGQIEVELRPQGTLAEAIRAGGAGIAAFYTPTGAGTSLGEGKETRLFEDGREYVLERTLRANVALIKAARADSLGNLVYSKTARNFNPIMATAADLVIAEVDEIVEPGELDPESIITPHLFVDVLALS